MSTIDGDVTSIVCARISEYFFVDVRQLSRATKFEEDLSADALILKDCIDSLEEELSAAYISFALDSAERREIETIGDLVDNICLHIIPRNENSNG